jgi:hypothetical protein
MNKDNSIIIQFDDDDNYHTVADLICYNLGLKISKFVSNLNEADQLLQSIKSGKLKPNIAIVSDSLGKNFLDGGYIFDKLKEIDKNIIVIAFTIDPECKWGDIKAMKSQNEPVDTLTIALNNIFSNKFSQKEEQNIF